MRRYFNSASKVKSQKSLGDSNVKSRFSYIPRRTSESMGLGPNITISQQKQRPSTSSASASGHLSRLQQMLKRVSITDRRPVKDTRPLMDKNYLQDSIIELYEFLTEKNYTFPYGRNILSNLTSKSFYHIFDFMYRWMDPGIAPVDKAEDLISIIKMIGYPFANTIKKSQLLVVGRQSLPALVGLLVWMMTVVKYAEEHDVKAFMINDKLEGSEFQNKLQECIFDGYAKFLSSGNENNKNILHELARECYGKPESLDELDDQKNDIAQQIASLDEQLEKEIELQNAIITVESDISKLDDYLEDMTNHINQKEKDIEELEKIEQEKLSECQMLQDEVSRLEKIYQDQEISTQSVDHVALQKTYLTKRIDENKDVLEEAKKTLWEKDVANANKVQQLRNKCSEINKKYQLLISHSQHIKFPEYEFHLSPDSSQYNKWLEEIKPELHNIIKVLEEKEIKNKRMLLEQQSNKKELSSQINEKELALQFVETKLEQQRKLQETRRQEMENENASYLMKYNDLKDKVVKFCQNSTKAQQQLRDEVWELEKQQEKLTEENERHQIESISAVWNLMNQVEEARKKKAEKMDRIAEKMKSIGKYP